MPIQAFYLEGKRRRFCLYHPPQGSVRGVVIGIHPFAEEMNRCRRMMALQAQALAAAGFGVLLVDLSGCGDSSGDFGEASWASWIEDVVDAGAWAHADSKLPIWLWGVRAGALIAADAASSIPHMAGLLLWQPVVAGKTYLRQFLRLRLASDMLDGGERVSVQALEDALAKGQPVEVAGYSLSPDLAAGLANAALVWPVGPRHCVCLEVSTREEKRQTPAVTLFLESVAAAGGNVRGAIVDGPAFWQTSEISECPSLLIATIAALTNCSP